MTQLIEEADSSDFTPNLDALVAMYRSIVIGGAAPAVYFRNVPTELKAGLPSGFVP